MKPTGWTTVRPGSLPDQAIVEQQGGVITSYRPSPYDIPEAFRGRVDDVGGRFIIEFRYLGDEPRSSERFDDVVSIEVGRHSSRLYAIAFDIAALKAHYDATLDVGAVREAQGALAKLLSRRPERGPSYKAADSIVRAVLRSPDFALAMP